MKRWTFARMHHPDIQVSVIHTFAWTADAGLTTPSVACLTARAQFLVRPTLPPPHSGRPSSVAPLINDIVVIRVQRHHRLSLPPPPPAE